MNVPRSTQFADARSLREAIRAGQFDEPTPGLCPGFVQTNLVIVPWQVADAFEQFCRLNPQPCPLIARTRPGDPQPLDAAPGADLRTDLSRYRVFRHGVAEPVEPHDIRNLWRDDLVGFLIGCSFTFEHALLADGYEIRHVSEGRNVPMYRTNVPCIGAGPFRGNLVVSMRPFRSDEVEGVRCRSGEFPRMHGAPVHVGDPAEIGIRNLARPDFGDAVTVRPGEVPVFWACGVTPQLALESARLELALTHSPGYMFVTDLRDELFHEG